ncbi:MAG TPA: hypothetical protein P5055_22630, partial [Candidatus Paceibacterota bacterium]|nr:hypothetical protein [Candidatus Paceibacterota bacterium]
MGRARLPGAPDGETQDRGASDKPGWPRRSSPTFALDGESQEQNASGELGQPGRSDPTDAG